MKRILALIAGVTDELIAEYIEYHDSDAECGTPCCVTEYEMACELRALRSENAGLRRDAGRYRWLCDGNGYFMEGNILNIISKDKEEADAAIDAAMQS